MSEEMIVFESTAAGNEPHRGRPASQLIPTLTLISHPLPQRVGECLLMRALEAGRPVELSRNAPDFLRPGGVVGLSLGDPFLSRKPLVFEPGPQGQVRLRGCEGGTRVVVGGRALQGEQVFTREELSLGVALDLAGRVGLLLHLAPGSWAPPGELLGMVGHSQAICRVREAVERVADLLVPVLIRGETGAGKELVARAIHQHSPRSQGRFVSVNMAALPKELAAAELFGALKGAYTGATRDREGLFRMADGGTLFLDEVGEAPPEVQVLLLRVLETGEIYPVGGQAPVRVDVRLVAATDANLEEQIRQGLFKAPLLHRLAGYEVRVPPLRERREDVSLLFHHFARQELEAVGEAHRLEQADPRAEPWLPAPLAARLVGYPWPGNVRQLRNVTRQLVISNRGLSVLHAEPQLERELVPAASLAPAERKGMVARRKPSEVSEPELLAALRESSWDFKAAADRLGIPRSSIYDLVDKSPHVRTASALGPEEIQRCFQECQGDLKAMAECLQVSKRGLLRRVRELGLLSPRA